MAKVTFESFPISVSITHSGKVIKSYDLDLANMNQFMFEAIMAYGAKRILNDTCGGKEHSPEDKIKLVDARLEKLKTGNYNKRAVARTLADFIIKAAIASLPGKTHADRKQVWDTAEQAQRDERIRKITEKSDPNYAKVYANAESMFEAYQLKRDSENIQFDF